MSNKKGFTLVELLAVIVILGFLMILVIPTYIYIFNGIKRDSLSAKISEIETAAFKYGSSIKDEIKEQRCQSITIDDLIKKGLIESDSNSKNEVIDPTTNKSLKGIVMICYSNKDLDIVANYAVPYEQNKIYYKDDKVYIGENIYKCLSQVNSKNYAINNLSQFELIYTSN